MNIKIQKIKCRTCIFNLRFPKSSVAKAGNVIKPNGKIGLRGCHGKCKFYSLKVLDKPTLPLSGKKPVQKVLANFLRSDG